MRAYGIDTCLEGKDSPVEDQAATGTCMSARATSRRSWRLISLRQAEGWPATSNRRGPPAPPQPHRVSRRLGTSRPGRVLRSRVCGRPANAVEPVPPQQPDACTDAGVRHASGEQQQRRRRVGRTAHAVRHDVHDGERGDRQAAGPHDGRPGGPPPPGSCHRRGSCNQQQTSDEQRRRRRAIVHMRRTGGDPVRGGVGVGEQPGRQRLDGDAAEHTEQQRGSRVEIARHAAELLAGRCHTSPFNPRRAVRCAIVAGHDRCVAYPAVPIGSMSANMARWSSANHRVPGSCRLRLPGVTMGHHSPRTCAA